MGRHRKPTTQHLLEGTLHTTRHAGRIHEPKFNDKPIRPKGMSREAQTLWDAIVPPLAEKGIAVAVDSPALEAMCEAWAEYKVAKGLRTKTLEDKARQGRMINNARRAWVEIASRFGLTPADRARLEIQAGADESNPFEMLLNDQPTLKIVND